MNVPVHKCTEELKRGKTGMKWKSDVIVECKDGLWLRIGDRKCAVAKADEVIVRKMEEGITDDEALLKCLSEETEESPAESGLRLAQFVVDYGDYIEEEARPKVFGI